MFLFLGFGVLKTPKSSVFLGFFGSLLGLKTYFWGFLVLLLGFEHMSTLLSSHRVALGELADEDCLPGRISLDLLLLLTHTGARG